MLENQPILASAWLALIAVAEHVLRFGRLLGNKRPLHPGRKPGAATSAQPGVLDLINNGVGLHGQRLLHGLVAIEFEVALDVSRTHPKAPGYDFHLLGM